jgi:hypothetical protein
VNLMADTGFGGGVLHTLKSLLRHGWRALTEVHTALWIVTDLLGIAVVPTALALWMTLQGVQLSIVIAIATLILGVCFLCLLALLGSRDEQRRIKSGMSQGACPQPAPPSRSSAAAPSVDPPLPANAKFKYRGKVFWALSRRYAKDEAEDMRRILREVYDSINTKSAPIVANYDGPAVMFTREWLSIIEGQGPRSAIAKLEDIRSAVGAAHTELQEIVGRKPYFRQDIAAIIDDRGDAGKLNGALNNYIKALKKLPEKLNVDVIKLALGSFEDKFKKAIDGYTKWISAFNTKTTLAREELEALME